MGRPASAFPRSAWARYVSYPFRPGYSLVGEVAALGPGVEGLATGLFATKAVNSAGNDGLFYGNPGLLGTQIVAVIAVSVFSILMTFVILKLIDVTIGLRVGEAEERAGLDQSQHGELAYTI